MIFSKSTESLVHKRISAVFRTAVFFQSPHRAAHGYSAAYVDQSAFSQPAAKIGCDIGVDTDELIRVLRQQELDELLGLAISFSDNRTDTCPRPKGRIAAKANISLSRRMTANFALSRKSCISAVRS
jgi:uncharacterized protein YijF (DUF1287 family)